MKALAICIVMLAFCACSQDKQVYICTGPRSEAYHKSGRCKGLSRCSREILRVTKEEARRMGRHECPWCH